MPQLSRGRQTDRKSMSEGKRYRAVVFDLYGTLIDIHTDEGLPRLWKTMAEGYTSHGAAYGPKELREVYLSAVVEEAARARGEWTVKGKDVRYPEPEIGRVFEALYSRKTGSEPDGAEEVSFGRGISSFAAETAHLFRGAAMMHLRLYAGAKELLTALRDAGAGVYLLSNAQRLYTVPEMRRLSISGLFDGVYISSDHGVKKPDPVFYEFFLKETGLLPEECLMVGNDLHCDIGGAKEAGMDTYYILSGLSPETDRERVTGKRPARIVPDYLQIGMDLRKTCRRILGLLG